MFQAMVYLLLFITFTTADSVLHSVGCLSSTSSPELQDLLIQCCETNDGIRRDCCSLVFPHVPLDQRCCSCSTNYSVSTSIPDYDVVKESMALPLLNSEDGCHPQTKNIQASTQQLLNKCCYVNSTDAVGVGMDCLALAFPHVPKDKRCGQCTSPGTIEDLVHECCSANYYDGDEERDCCAILRPFRSKDDQKFCPCPRSQTPAHQHQNDNPHQHHEDSIQKAFNTESIEILASNSTTALEKITKYCDPRTQNVSPTIQKLLNKCCLTHQNMGHQFQNKKKLDCLALAFPSVPWNGRCGSCHSELPAQDLIRECCKTKDGIRRNCCGLVYPKVQESERFCPCSSHGEHHLYPETLPTTRTLSNSHSSHHRQHHQHRNHPYVIPHHGKYGNRPTTSAQFISNGLANYMQRIQTAEAAINLHTYCCNTEGKQEFGFNCEKLVLGVEPASGNGNRPCGAWSNTLEPYEPTGIANTDYTDYDYTN